MNNLIFNAFAFKEDYLASPQIGGRASDRTIDIYMKNAYVSLYSAKVQNPQDDLALVTNCELPSKYKELFTKANIQIIKIEFNEFIMPKTFVWSLAFFKLCALKWIVNNTDYEKILLLDTDTITIHSYKELWLEAQHGLLLYNIKHSYGHKDRQIMVHDYQRLYNNDKNLVHYGGEFICGTNKVLKKFSEECDKVYNAIKENDFDISKNEGDELIISIAAISMDNVIEAGAYIYRYWTGKFYLVSTNYINNPVSIWHIPSEKNIGIIRIYYAYMKGTPSVNKMARILGFPKYKRPFSLFYLIYRIINKLGLA
jgi:hypothetical protein